MPRRPPSLVHPGDWAFFLDLDGTLVDLANTPHDITVAPSTAVLLGKLHLACGGALALVSGRSLADLERRFAGLPVALAGQHGLERKGAGNAEVPAASLEALAGASRHLETLVARHPGLHLEDKGRSLALHYRKSPQLAGYAHRTVRRLVCVSGERLCIQRGKWVVEIKPPGFDKGKAILAYMDEPIFRGRRPVFIGDDLTDEDGFAAVNRLEGLSIKVGPGKSCARYRLANVAAVRAWLASMT